MRGRTVGKATHAWRMRRASHGLPHAADTLILESPNADIRLMSPLGYFSLNVSDRLHDDGSYQ